MRINLFAAKALVLALILFEGYRLLRRKMPVKQLFKLGFLTIAVALLASWASNYVPSLTDRVTLTALGEKREEAGAPEVYLNGYTVDGIEYTSLDDLQIEEGKWFWSGNSYCWRPETDPRQPEGVTRTVILRIPVGLERTLNFDANEWRGKVEISTGGDAWCIDTYSEPGGDMLSEPIGRSRMVKLVSNFALKLLVYTVALCAFAILTGIITAHTLRDPQKASRRFRENKGRIVRGIIALITFVFMVYYADVTQLWGDEFAQIGFVNQSIYKAVYYCLDMVDSAPPLFAVCAWFWYRIAPWGERWLLLLTIVPTCLAIYCMGAIVERVKNASAGVFASVLMASSYTIWNNHAYEFRSYAFPLLFSTLALYCYVRRNEARSGCRWHLAFSGSMAMLAMSHYFGMLACAGFFVGDLYLYLHKKISWKAIFEYFVPGIPSAIWLAGVYFVRLRKGPLGSNLSWQLVPTFSSIDSLLKYLVGDNEIIYWLLIVSLCISAVLWINGKSRGSYEFLFSSGMIFGTIMLVFVYGNVINRTYTMWSNRYFVCLIPFVVFLISSVVCEVSWKVERVFACNIPIIMVFSLFLALVAGDYCMTRVQQGNGIKYREAADWVYTQSNEIFNHDTAIVLKTARAEGWYDYYLTRKGRRDGIPTFSQFATEESFAANESIIANYNTIYLIDDGGGVQSWLLEILNKDFEKTQSASYNQVSVYERKQ